MKNKLYFSDLNIEFATSKASIIEEMKEYNIKELDIFEAKRELKTNYFFCKHAWEVGEIGNCGKQCDNYKPRNGKSGCCKHRGYCYEISDVKSTIKLS